MYKCFENYSIVYTLRKKTKLSSFKKRFFIHFIRRWVVWYRCHREIFNCKSVCRHTLHICVADKINEWIIICLLVCFWFACSTFYLKSVTQSTDWLIGRCGQKVMTLKKHWNYIRGSCAAKLNIFTALSIHKFHIRTHVASLDAFFSPLWLPQRSFVIKIWVIRSFISCEVHLSCVTLVWNSCLDCFRFIPVSSWSCCCCFCPLGTKIHEIPRDVGKNQTRCSFIIYSITWFTVGSIRRTDIMENVRADGEKESFHENVF